MDKIKKLISEKEIDKRVKELSNILYEEYKDEQVAAVLNGVIKEIYEVDNWYYVKERDRWAFNGKKISSKYVNKRIQDKYMKKGAQNPFRYIF